MKVKIYEDYEAMSEAAADEMIGVIQEKADAVICLASGHTPLLTCQRFVKKLQYQSLDISAVRFFGLDEWVGVPPANEGSCHYFFQETIFKPLHLPANQIYLFDGMSNDLSGECKKMDDLVAAKGGIDLMVVGIGLNGHIGFNEPGVPFTNYSQVIDLDENTKTVGQKYFPTTTILSKGITMGLQHLMNARRVILLANGEKKAEILKKAVEEKPAPSIPATILQNHSNSVIMADKAAASDLAQNFPDEIA